MRSPHRHRADAEEAWRLLLFGEILRALEPGALRVRADESIRLPRSGRWETGLARLRPALDDVLGHTALAVAWRWACAQKDANAWPSLELVALKAVDSPVSIAEIPSLAEFEGGSIETGAGEGRGWTFEGSIVRVKGALDVDFFEVDRIARIAQAWLIR